MKKLLKVVIVALSLAFVSAQFMRPSRVNPPVVAGHSIEEQSALTPQVSEVLNRSCMDCHSNRTDWPWYSNVAPVSWFVIDHVNHGRSHLNFSEWMSYDRAQVEARLKGICALSKGGAMPLDSYTLIHRGARLSPEDVKTLCDWAGAEHRRLASLN
jgi:hypothetical protein